MSNTSNEIIRMIENAESNHHCIRPITSAQKQYAYRCVKKGTFVRTFRNLYARTEYWKKLYPSEKMRHIAISLMEIYPEWKFTGTTAAALLGYDIVENYDYVEDGSDNIQRNFSSSVSSTKIYIRSSVHKSANDIRICIGLCEHAKSRMVQVMTCALCSRVEIMVDVSLRFRIQVTG